MVRKAVLAASRCARSRVRRGAIRASRVAAPAGRKRAVLGRPSPFVNAPQTLRTSFTSTCPEGPSLRLAASIRRSGVAARSRQRLFQHAGGAAVAALWCLATGTGLAISVDPAYRRSGKSSSVWSWSTRCDTRGTFLCRRDCLAAAAQTDAWSFPLSVGNPIAVHYKVGFQRRSRWALEAWAGCRSVPKTPTPAAESGNGARTNRCSKDAQCGATAAVSPLFHPRNLLVSRNLPPGVVRDSGAPIS